MEQEVLDKYIKAGKIAAQVLEYGCGLVKKDVLVLEIAENIDKKILELKARPAFPVNISINDMAAHWHPALNDKATIKEGDYVKIDVGVHVDGYIGDTAKTVRIAGKDDLVICSEKMLENAIKIIKTGTTVGEIGETIENTAKEFGFNPIRNLTGHSLGKYDVHAGLTIPNIKNDSKYQLREDEVIAIEPFCTSGNGLVKDSGKALIFRWINDRPTRLIESRKILEMARDKFNRLPFAKRWIQKGFSLLKVELSLKELEAVNALYGYKPLREVSGKPVAQSEHSLIVKEKPIVTTILQ
ncbi:MAG: type II methionyl aminopeptidase [Candidatus Aenigmarchaeota archaeon]|nr:type II methionyl aminopeptidase [Candidatus Aenigmarchaeota archaeon]